MKKAQNCLLQAGSQPGCLSQGYVFFSHSVFRLGPSSKKTDKTQSKTGCNNRDCVEIGQLFSCARGVTSTDLQATRQQDEPFIGAKAGVGPMLRESPRPSGVQCFFRVWPDLGTRLVSAFGWTSMANLWQVYESMANLWQIYGKSMVNPCQVHDGFFGVSQLPLFTAPRNRAVLAPMCPTLAAAKAMI